MPWQGNCFLKKYFNFFKHTFQLYLLFGWLMRVPGIVQEVTSQFFYCQETQFLDSSPGTLINFNVTLLPWTHLE